EVLTLGPILANACSAPPDHSRTPLASRLGASCVSSILNRALLTFPLPAAALPLGCRGARQGPVVPTAGPSLLAGAVSRANPSFLPDPPANWPSGQILLPTRCNKPRRWLDQHQRLSICKAWPVSIRP